MATTKRTEVVTLDGLNASIDKALALAAKRHGAVFEAGTVAINWEIFGRRLKLIEKAGTSRLDVATTVVAGLKLTGPQPVVLGGGKWILVGFWDPQLRNQMGMPQ
jgi:hypothetical protein